MLKKLSFKFQNFMRYRYGVDTLTKHGMNLILVLLLVNLFLKSFILNSFTLVFALWINFRMFSKKGVKRSAENRAYLKMMRKVSSRFKRMKDLKDFKYFKCPQCKQEMRAPRKRGAIVVTCQKCKNRFDMKT